MQLLMAMLFGALAGLCVCIGNLTGTVAVDTLFFDMMAGVSMVLAVSHIPKK